MTDILKGLLARLGWRRESGTRSIALDASLHTALMGLAEQEHRPVDEVQADLLTTALAQRQMNGEMHNGWQGLSRREQEVTALACLGYSNRQIAAKMDISPGTVKAYVRQILVKFGYHSKYELKMRLGTWDFSKWGPKAQD